MPRYIDVNKIKFSGESFNDVDGDVLVYLFDVRKAIDQTPTADVVEVRHGEWHYNSDGTDWGLGAWECSLCGCKNDNLPMDEKINPRVWAGAKYCPNCGAKMYGERKERK